MPDRVERLGWGVDHLAHVGHDSFDGAAGFGQTVVYRLGERFGEAPGPGQAVGESPGRTRQSLWAEHYEPDGQEGHYFLWAEVEHR
jgi:hypothetical protein